MFDSFRLSESFCIPFPPKGLFQTTRTPDCSPVIYFRLFGNAGDVSACACACESVGKHAGLLLYMMFYCVREGDESVMRKTQVNPG